MSSKPKDGSCGWPFHNAKDCGECDEWEAKYGESMDKYLAELDAARKARRKKLSDG